MELDTATSHMYTCRTGALSKYRARPSRKRMCRGSVTGALHSGMWVRSPGIPSYSLSSEVVTVSGDLTESLLSLAGKNIYLTLTNVCTEIVISGSKPFPVAQFLRSPRQTKYSTENKIHLIRYKTYRILSDGPLNKS